MALAIALLASCRSKPPATEDVTVWQSRGTWSGRGSQQTAPFISNTGVLRLTWEARGSSKTPFKIFVHSDVSGRPLLTAVDRIGGGKDVTYVQEDPRSFFLVIESADLEWTVEVSEGVAGVRTQK
ncbi:MAG TPA: hypothetical protein VJ691_17300 [Vicinamibacterales bacterium]|nr:hypothetical protein [Vicinamibacterales bacterium]